MNTIESKLERLQIIEIEISAYKIQGYQEANMLANAKEETDNLIRLILEEKKRLDTYRDILFKMANNF
ncbi:MAG: hypothetical protein ABI091_03330 [Ferruginibacter sp.]